MQVEFEQHEAAYICHVEGNLENLTVPDFREAMAGLPEGVGVVLDLGAVSFVDSAGLGALIGAVRKVRDRGGDAVICRPRPSVERVLHLVGIPRIVPVCKDMKGAIAHFSGQPAA